MVVARGMVLAALAMVGSVGAPPARAADTPADERDGWRFAYPFHEGRGSEAPTDRSFLVLFFKKEPLAFF